MESRRGVVVFVVAIRWKLGRWVFGWFRGLWVEFARSFRIGSEPTRGPLQGMVSYSGSSFSLFPGISKSPLTYKEPMSAPANQRPFLPFLKDSTPATESIRDIFIVGRDLRRIHQP